MSDARQRRLAAIMFTDIVGYTALMQQDEQQAMLLRDRHRAVFKEAHEHFAGEIIQYYGDGTLSIFSSAVEACNCAIYIQQQLKQGSHPVPLRIGIHMGDIVYDRTEVYGDAVNLASRVESLAISGSVLISETVQEQLKNHERLQTQAMGAFQFKNIAQPVDVFALSDPELTIPVANELHGKADPAPEKSIAVLPFVNMSAGDDHEYFSDGITEEIINALSKIEGLKVTSRTSSFFFKNKALPVKKIAQELGVSALLEGSVRVAGDALRITAQLIQAEGDYHFWSETWDRKMENIFETQDEISLLIAERLREQFGHFEIQEHLVTKQTEDLSAYDLVLKGRYLRGRWNPEDVNEAMGYFEQAVAIDDQYAEAYAELADGYSFLGTTGFLPYEEGWMKAHTYTLKADALQKNLAGVYYQLSNEAFFMEADHAKSLALMNKGLKAEPNNAKVREFLSFLYILKGDKEEARQHLDVALAINPMSQETSFFKGYFHYMCDELDLAERILDQCLVVNDKNIPAHAVKLGCMLSNEQYEEILDYHDNIPQEVVIPEEKSGYCLLAHSILGHETAAAQCRALLQEQSQGHNAITASSFFFFEMVLKGEMDKAFAWIADAMENRNYVVPLRITDPILSPLRSDARYDGLLKQVFGTSSESNQSKSTKALMDEKSASNAEQVLLQHLEETQPFLNPDLTLRMLAEELELAPNQLSWLINARLGKNFNDLINQHRIATFKKLAEDPANAGITIMGLAYDSGFNSKTTFNTKFKKETGLTPKQYLQSVQS